MGKSSVLDYIARTLKTFPYFINTEVVNCKKIKGKTADSLHKFFTDMFAKLILSQPSLLILDDLHALCEACEGEETPNSVYFNRYVSCFSCFCILKNFTKKSYEIRISGNNRILSSFME